LVRCSGVLDHGEDFTSKATDQEKRVVPIASRECFFDRINRAHARDAELFLTENTFT
jgi:hypothetical protein